jgi:hypothetical protein
LLILSAASGAAPPAPLPEETDEELKDLIDKMLATSAVADRVRLWSGSTRRRLAWMSSDRKEIIIDQTMFHRQRLLPDL